MLNNFSFPVRILLESSLSCGIGNGTNKYGILLQCLEISIRLANEVFSRPLICILHFHDVYLSMSESCICLTYLLVKTLFTSKGVKPVLVQVEYTFFVVEDFFHESKMLNILKYLFLAVADKLASFLSSNSGITKDWV